MEHIGILEDLIETAVQVGGKRFYLPPEIRARIIKEFKPDVEAKTKVSVTYSRKGDLQGLSRFPQSTFPVGESPPRVPPEGTEVHIYPTTNPVEGNSQQAVAETLTKQPEPEVPVQKEGIEGEKVHIEVQSSGSAPQVTLDDPSSHTPKKTAEKKMKEASAFTEFTKNKTIAIEFCISKASDIVAKHWEKIPPDDEHQRLTDKVNDIKKVSDQLLEYLIKKIGEN